MVLNMVYSIRDYWVFGFCPSSSILRNTKEHKFRKPDFLRNPDFGQIPKKNSANSETCKRSCHVQFRHTASHDVSKQGQVNSTVH
jgi:hypothetical protein